MEMEERRQQVQVESDQAMMRMITQVMTTVAAHSAPTLHAPPYPNQMVSRSYLPEEPTFQSYPQTTAKHYGFRLWSRRLCAQY